MFFENELGMVTVERDIGTRVKCSIFVEDENGKAADDVLDGTGSTYHTTIISIRDVISAKG